ncbi:MAG: hypothetical protein JOZ58_16170 [Acetobacteraceae bacterium]|nr:hypothetical protein [Acetobacteraceae bacterium]
MGRKTESDYAYEVKHLRELGEWMDVNPVAGVELAETLLKVRNRRGRYVPLKANRVQREYQRRRGHSKIVLKARQLGITTGVAGQFFLKTITRPGTLSVQVAHTREAAEEIFRIVHRFYNCMPDAWREGVLETSRANVRQLIFPAIDSEYRVESAGDVNAGRGLTVQNLHLSEVARWPGDAAETMASLRAALAPDGELVLESTPRGAHGCFYEEWMGAEQAGMVRHFFPWWWEEGYAGAAVASGDMSEDERGLMEREALTAEQIGFRRHLKARFRGLMAQEYAESPEACFLASGACVFDLEAIERRAAMVREPMQKRLNGQLHVWYPAVAGKQYLVAVDPAGGGDRGDFSTVQVIEVSTGLQCAELQGRLGTLELAKEAANLGREYGDALVVVERNNHGSGVLAYLDSVARYPNIYEQNGLAGWLTSALSRPQMVGRFGAMLVEAPEIFESARLLAECRSFVRHKDGKTGAAAGSHDDCVMAMTIALSVRTELLEGRR